MIRLTRRIGFTFAAMTLAASLGGAAAGVAHADCTGAGDFGAASGCEPPGDTSGSDGGDSWPPTSIDWPPPQANSSGSGNDEGGDASVPIVMPDGQTPPARPAHITDTSTVPTPMPAPIVAFGAPAAGPAPTVIASPGTSGS